MSRLITALVLAVTWSAVASFAPAQEAPKVEAPAKPDHSKKVEEKLALPAEGQYLDTQLGDVVLDLQLRYDMRITIDNTALAADGLSRETPISLSLKGVRLGSLLNHILLPHGLDWMIRDEMLIFTTKKAAGENEDTRVYPVGELAARPGFSYESLLAVIYGSISPDMWRVNGGPIASMTSLPARQALVITAPSRRHREIARLLEVLKELKPDSGLGDSTGTAIAEEGKIRQALMEQSEVQYLDTQLNDVAMDLHLRHHVPIVIDRTSLKADGRDETLLSAQLKNVSFGSVLGHLLGSRELAWVVSDETIVVTTKTAAISPEKLNLRVYAVGDLIDSAPAGKETDPFIPFRDMIETSVTADQWASAGGFAGYESFPSGKAVVIRHSEDGHRRVAALLTQLRMVKAGGKPDAK